MNTLLCAGKTKGIAEENIKAAILWVAFLLVVIAIWGHNFIATCISINIQRSGEFKNLQSEVHREMANFFFRFFFDVLHFNPWGLIA